MDDAILENENLEFLVALLEIPVLLAVQFRGYYQLAFIVYAVLAAYHHALPDVRLDPFAIRQVNADLGFRVGLVYVLAARTRRFYEVPLYVVLFDRHVLVRTVFLRTEQVERLRRKQQGEGTGQGAISE